MLSWSLLFILFVLILVLFSTDLLYIMHGTWLLLSCFAFSWDRTCNAPNADVTVLHVMRLRFVKRWHTIQILTLRGGITPLLFFIRRK